MIVEMAKETLTKAPRKDRLRLVWGWMKDKYASLTFKEFSALIEHVNQLEKEGR